MTTHQFGRFFLPGPTDVHPDILAAMARPMIAHRGKDMTAVLNAIADPMKKVFRTEKTVFVGSCSATGFMEMAVRCGVRQRCLSLVSGAFGERFAAIAGATGREVVRLDVPLGKTVDPEVLRDAIKRSDVDAVTLVHSETSTGALAPLEELSKVVHEFDDVMLLVDAVTSMAGSPVETDKWNLDFVLTGSQKAMALPPGLALGAASDRMLARAKTIPEKGAYLDVVAYHEAFVEGQPTNTPAVSLFFALQRQLERITAEGGIEARWARHEAMLRATEKWVAGPGARHGVSYVPVAGHRSWTVSCLKLPEGKTSKPITDAFLKEGWTIGSGYGKLKDNTIRIGHMGDHTVAGLTDLLNLLDRILS